MLPKLLNFVYICTYHLSWYIFRRTCYTLQLESTLTMVSMHSPSGLSGSHCRRQRWLPRCRRSRRFCSSLFHATYVRLSPLSEPLDELIGAFVHSFVWLQEDSPARARGFHGAGRHHRRPRRTRNGCCGRRCRLRSGRVGGDLGEEVGGWGHDEVGRDDGRGLEEGGVVLAAWRRHGWVAVALQVQLLQGGCVCLQIDGDVWLWTLDGTSDKVLFIWFLGSSL